MAVGDVTLIAKDSTSQSILVNTNTSQTTEATILAKANALIENKTQIITAGSGTTSGTIGTATNVLSIAGAGIFNTITVSNVSGHIGSVYIIVDGGTKYTIFNFTSSMNTCAIQLNVKFATSLVIQISDSTGASQPYTYYAISCS